MKTRVVVIAAILLAGAPAVLWRAGAFSRSKSVVESPSPVSVQIAAVPDPTVAPAKPVPTEAPYVPPQPHDPKLAALVNRNLPEDQRVSGDISAKIPRVKPEDFAVLIAVLLDTKDSDTVRNEVANLLRRSKCPNLSKPLTQVLDNPQEKARFRSFAVQFLGGILADEDTPAGERAEVSARLKTALTDRDTPVRREALLSLVRQRDQQAIDTAVKWLYQTADEKPSPYPLPQGERKTSQGEKETPQRADAGETRDLAIRCIRELDLREHLPVIRKYATDANEVIRIAALVTLAQWGDEESRPACEEAASSKSVRLQRAGKAALERLDKVKAESPSAKAPSSLAPLAPAR